MRDLCRRTREATDRAVFFNNGSAHSADICIHGHGGMAVFPLICVTDPDYVRGAARDRHGAVRSRTCAPCCPRSPPTWTSSCWRPMTGARSRTPSPRPRSSATLFLPYRRRINDECHRLAPAACKTFLHSCGAIYDILDLIIESGFDIVNPVQWPAGGHSYREWKDKARGRITLWGGGVNSQHTLPLGTRRRRAPRGRRGGRTTWSRTAATSSATSTTCVAEIPPRRSSPCTTPPKDSLHDIT